MSANKKFSTTEPAYRPFKVDLSEAEILALSNWHLNAAKRIPALVGKTALKFSAENLFRSSREQRALLNHARQQVDAHCKRAQGLQSIIRK